MKNIYWYIYIYFYVCVDINNFIFLVLNWKFVKKNNRIIIKYVPFIIHTSTLEGEWAMYFFSFDNGFFPLTIYVRYK